VSAEEIPAGARAAELTRVFDAWLDTKRPSWRMKLLVGSPGLDRPLDRRYFVATSARGVEAFCTVLPGGPGAFGVDVMCRRPDAEPGAMELLLTRVLETLRDEGASTCSLGPCPMAGVPLDGDRPLLRRIVRALYASRLGNQVFGFRNLHRFKQKFRPRFEPVYFAAAPSLGVLALYRGCRMWGLY
jgi:phosphatidylglycerol lysyltransferase